MDSRIEFIVDVVVMLMGVISTIRSSYWCYYFSKSRKAIGKAVAFMIFGEAFSLFVVCIFSLLALINVLAGMPTIYASAMRLTMFIVAIASTDYLAVRVKRIENENDIE